MQKQYGLVSVINYGIISRHSTLELAQKALRKRSGTVQDLRNPARIVKFEFSDSKKLDRWSARKYV